MSLDLDAFTDLDTNMYDLDGFVIRAFDPPVGYADSGPTATVTVSDR